MSQLASQFGIQPILLAAQAVNFLVLLFILNKLLYKPILKVLDERKSKIARGIKDAEQIEKQLLKLDEERESILDQATKDAQAVLADAQKSATEIMEQARQKAQTEMESIVQKSRQQIEQDRLIMRQEIRDELADLVAVGLQVVAGKSLTKKDKATLAEKSLKNLS